MTDAVSGDTGTKLTAIVKDTNAAVVDLTGATVRLRWLNETVVTTVTATITDDAAGAIEYLFLAGELIAPGMDIEVEVEDSGGLINTSLEVISLVVREQIG